MSQKNVLIITPYADFGAIINQSLESDPSLCVTVASNIFEVQAYKKNGLAYNYALLDLDLGEKRALELGFSLRGNFPSIEIILISKKEPSLEMDELRPWKVLRKPFVQSDLASLFQNVNTNFSASPEMIDLNFVAEVDNTPRAWWEDESRVTKTLISAISNLDIQEAILFSSEDILAQAGKMDVDTIEECSKLVGKFHVEKSTSEILKPIQLKTTKTNHYIHANILAVGIILALLYDADTPLRNIRLQSRYLTNILKNPQLTMPEIFVLPTTSEGGTEEYQLEAPTQRTYSGNAHKRTTKPQHPRMTFQSYRMRKHQIETTLRQEVTTGISMEDFEPAENSNGTPANSPQVNAVEELLSAGSRIASHTAQDEGDHQKSHWDQETLLPTSSSVQIPRSVHHFSLCSTDTSMFDVFYSCLLIPRLKSQSLEGDLANFLKEMLPDVFLANSWRLTAVDIGSSFMQWLVRIPPTIAPAEHINIVRTQSSRKILSVFTRLNRDELLKDFWAPGYLLGSGQSLFSEEDINLFIQLNRKQYYPEDNGAGAPERKYQLKHNIY